MRARGVRVAADQRLGRLLRRFDEPGVALKVGKAQQRIATLPRSQVFSRAAQLEIAACNLKSVVVFKDNVEALACVPRKRTAKKQYTYALARAAPDSTAQLVQLRKAQALGAVDYH